MALNKNSLHDVKRRDKAVKNLIFGENHEDDESERLSYSPTKTKPTLGRMTKKTRNSESDLLKSESEMQESTV